MNQWKEFHFMTLSNIPIFQHKNGRIKKKINKKGAVIDPILIGVWIDCRYGAYLPSRCNHCFFL